MSTVGAMAAIRGECLFLQDSRALDKTPKSDGAEAHEAVALDLTHPPLAEAQSRPTRKQYLQGLTRLLQQVEAYAKKKDEIKLDRDLEDLDDMGESAVIRPMEKLISGSGKLTVRYQDLERRRKDHTLYRRGGRKA
jgi:hypothetical protein